VAPVSTNLIQHVAAPVLVTLVFAANGNSEKFPAKADLQIQVDNFSIA
jgi:hypothetical protein